MKQALALSANSRKPVLVWVATVQDGLKVSEFFMHFLFSKSLDHPQPQLLSFGWLKDVTNSLERILQFPASHLLSLFSLPLSIPL